MLFKGTYPHLNFAVLNLNLVAAQHDRDILADTNQVAVPVRHVLVRDATRNVEHDDRALALDVVAVPESAEALLARRVPDVELDGAAVRVEDEGVHFHTCAEHRSNRVRIHSKSKNKPPTTSSPGDESHRWREGVSTLQNTEIRT